MFPKRTGLIVWVQDLKPVRYLERFGNILYMSKRLNYVLLYMNKSELPNKMTQIEKLNFVKKVELSHRAEINTKFPTKNK